MTRHRVIGTDTEYCDWLRQHPDLDSVKYGYDRRDLDISWFDYKKGKIMLISEKTRGAQSDAAERDTYGIWDQCAKYACSRIGFERAFPNRPKRIAYYGYHEVTFELEGPREGWIKIDGEYVSIDQLLLFHKFEFFPLQQEVYAWNNRQQEEAIPQVEDEVNGGEDNSITEERHGDLIEIHDIPFA